MQTKSKAVHNPADFERLCNRATELVPRYGSRALAFRAARLENPQLNATPPAGEDVTVKGRCPAVAQSESGGVAKSWSGVFQTIGVKTKSDGVKCPADTQPESGGIAKAWSVVFQGLGVKTKSGAKPPAGVL